jgi:hypothetical protein
MARCTDCDTLLTDLDRAAMQRINDDYRHHGASAPFDLAAEPPYEQDDEGADGHFQCVDCLDRDAERAQERRDEDYYGGDTPTLAETAAYAQKFK